jgi:hypothetical protein
VGSLLLLLIAAVFAVVIPTVRERRAIAERPATPSVKVIQQEFPKAAYRMSIVGMTPAQFSHHWLGEGYWPGPSGHLILEDIPRKTFPGRNSGTSLRCVRSTFCR